MAEMDDEALPLRRAVARSDSRPYALHYQRTCIVTVRTLALLHKLHSCPFCQLMIKEEGQSSFH